VTKAGSGGFVSRKTVGAGVSFAWLLQHSPHILLIPGTSSVEHLRYNVAAAGFQLAQEAIKELNAIAGENVR
jgi:Aldo/keto reductase family